jgi:hypothetical protein
MEQLLGHGTTSRLRHDANTVNLKTNHRAGRGGERLDSSLHFEIDKGFSPNLRDCPK